MIGAVVLAAGASRRYGYANKLLAPVAGRPLIAHTLRTLARSRVAAVVVVTGHDHRRVAAACRRAWPRRAGLRCVTNPDHATGMASSLRIGLEALPIHVDQALVCLADTPGLSPRLIRRVLAARAPGVDYVRPVRAGHPGHPVLLSARLWPDIRAVQGDRGAQPVLAKVAPQRRRLLPVSARPLADVDTPSAGRRWARRR